MVNKHTLADLIAVKAYLADRRQSVRVAAAQLENANTTYSHPARRDELRRLTETLAGFDALADHVAADIRVTLRQMEAAE
jgi:ABC-type transporter Mla subunit MlaD